MLPLLASLLCCAGCTRPERGPNVVFIVIDTLRADHLPFGGYDRDTAPFLTELASRGLVFSKAHSVSSWTAPATASIFTSLYPFQHQVLSGLLVSADMRIDLNRIPEEIETVAELFRNNGFTTFAVTDNLNICETEGFQQGFDYFENFNYEAADAVNLKLLEWERQIARARRSFVYLHYMDPHVPYNRREPWFREPADPDLSDLAAYDSEISYVDAKIEELYERFGWDENTLIVVTSDHGEEFGDHGGIDHGHTLYSELIDVPLLFFSPGFVPTGVVDSERVSTMDILPTLAEILDLQSAMDHEGMSLAPFFRGASIGRQTRGIYSHLFLRGRGDQPVAVMKSIIHDNWKLITNGSDTDEPPTDTWLFDLGSDPREHDNLQSRQPEIAAMLEQRMRNLETQAREFAPESELFDMSPEFIERLRALGYVD